MLKQVLNYGFLSILLISYIESCPIAMQSGWKQLPLVQRAKMADVVAVGKTVDVQTDLSVSRRLKTGGFELLDILKGKDIIEKIYANYSDSIFYILGFGSPAECLTPIELGETNLLFVIFEPNSLSLVVAYDTPFGGTAKNTVENQDKILASLGWRPWSDWSSCSVSCGGGSQSRTRICVTGNCDGDTTTTRACNSYKCEGTTNVLQYFTSKRNSRSISSPEFEDLKINGLGNLSVPTYKILHSFPRHFTMFAAAKYVSYTQGYLVSFYDANDKLQIGIKVSKTSVTLEYAQAKKDNQFLAFNVEVVDRKWHQFAFSVGNGLVSFYLDCEMIGTRKITADIAQHVDGNGNVYLSAETVPPKESEKNIEFYIRELSISNDVEAGREQCILKDLYDSSEGSGIPTASPDTPEFYWTDWNKCSKTCGSQGVTRRVKMCKPTSWSKSHDKCQALLQQSEEKPCNIKPCPTNCKQRCRNGVCTSKYKCKCKRNYYGTYCENKRASCRQRCKNGGRCLAYKGTCRCPKGYSGQYCETVTCVPKCHYGGVCVKPGVCKCRQGHHPPLCKPSCPQSCMNKGICIMPNVCRCRKGYSGDRCQYAECKKLCLNGGVCYDNNKCNCKSGWTGDSCHIAICHPKCKNGGKCRSPNRCSCPNKTSGTYCQNVVCTPRCLNGGQCLRQDICLCPRKYSGPRCETPVCRPNCVNGGKCVAPNQCVCPSGYFGNLCDRSSAEENTAHSYFYKYYKMVSPSFRLEKMYPGKD